MSVVGVGLVKVYKALIRLVSGDTPQPPSDVYVRSFLFFTLIKLCYTKLLSNQAWSLVPKLNLLLQRSRIQHRSP